MFSIITSSSLSNISLTYFHVTIVSIKATISHNVASVVFQGISHVSCVVSLGSLFLHFLMVALTCLTFEEAVLFCMLVEPHPAVDAMPSAPCIASLPKYKSDT